MLNWVGEGLMFDFIKKLFLKTDKLQLQSGNSFFYTRTGVGVEFSNENKIKNLRRFAIKDQLKLKPDLKKLLNQ